MTQKYRTITAQIATKSLELSIAAPQVVAQRMAQMGAAGMMPSAADQREFAQMGHEKVQAFFESWTAMWSTSIRSQMQFAKRLPGATISAAFGKTAPAVSMIHELSNTGASVMAAGLTPVHAKAVSNAKRLRTRKAR